MKDKGHFFVSLAKSVIRIWGCYGAAKHVNVAYLAAFFIIAEMFGVIEELVDAR